MSKFFKIVLIIALNLAINSCKQTDKSGVDTTDIKQPNILWIVSEDNSPWIGAYGDSMANTPNLDKLAKKGILFSNAHSNAPVCAPSRSTLIMGRYANGMGTQHMRSSYSIPDSIRFYPEFLREAGYYTTNNVKKDYNTVDRPQAWDESSKTATYKNRKEGQPFFHIQNLTTTHESNLHLNRIPKTNPRQVKLYPYHPDTPEMRQDYAVYYDCMKDLDTQIGTILSELENEGLAQETIVFYYADHGGPVAGTKRFATQQGLNVPLIVHVPERFQHLTKYKNGSRVNRPVGFIDFAPELMQLAGIEIPTQFQGKPFLNPQDDEHLVFGFADRMDENMNMVRTVTDGKYRYTRNYFPHWPYGTYIDYLWKAPGMRSWHREFLNGTTNKVQSAFFQPKPFEELYDIEADPFQLNNLIDNIAFNEVRQQLSRALTKWQIDIRDTGFIPEGMLTDLDEMGHVRSYSQSENYRVEEIMALVEKVNLNPELYQADFWKGLESNNRVLQFWAAQGLLKIYGLKVNDLNILKKRIYGVPPETGIVLAEVLLQNGEVDFAEQFLLEILDNPRLVNRLQALHVIERFSKRPIVFKEKLKEIGAQQSGRKQSYDTRKARYLLEKINS